MDVERCGLRGDVGVEESNAVLEEEELRHRGWDLDAKVHDQGVTCTRSTERPDLPFGNTRVRLTLRGGLLVVACRSGWLCVCQHSRRRGSCAYGHDDLSFAESRPSTCSGPQ